MTVQITMKVGLKFFHHNNDRNFLPLVELEKVEDEIFFFNKVIMKEEGSRKQDISALYKWFKLD